MKIIYLKYCKNTTKKYKLVYINSHFFDEISKNSNRKVYIVKKIKCLFTKTKGGRYRQH